ncbi:hypothetical protein [Nocardia pseudobrasiliensis]|uniref:Uncharacterized protein n=1 Tax=Nocardia pseudobrasiliensis TaxID=45979 RepID=A0A370IF58_9NOCA|nr:hypothetical protein [Nocardia pseudobrasiliensis]RDI68781.1 hypothetical protein DFR76_101316 [Nocardia pseudobrasiliensis]
MRFSAGTLAATLAAAVTIGSLGLPNTAATADATRSIVDREDVDRPGNLQPPVEPTIRSPARSAFDVPP